MSYAWVTIVRGRLLADLSIAAIWSGAVVRKCVGPSSVARLGYVEVGCVEIIFTSHADERE